MRISVERLVGFTILSITFLVSLGCTHTYFVDGSYTGPETGTQAQPFRTVARALSTAVSRDIVIVVPGLYRENVTIPDGVVLRSPKVGAAILHGGAGRSGGNPTVTTGNGSELSGFTITGGYDGVMCRGSSPTIRRNVIRGNYGDGGVICLDGCRAMIENNTVLGQLGNTTNNLGIGIYVENATPTLRNNIVTGNDIGYAPYLATPVESYNLIGGNRRDFGYSAAPGTGTLTPADPGFLAPDLDDYRLAAGSPARDAGDPAPAYNDADGSRNDIGAFDGDGGYAVGLPTQEYFVESVLGAVDQAAGPRFDGTSRFNADPVFWFDASGRGTQGETDGRALLTVAVGDLTDGLYSAAFRASTTAPADPCQVVTVTFDGPRGVAFRQGAGVGCGDASLERSGAPIIGGELHLASSWTRGFAADPTAVETVIHELGHVGGLRHSFRGPHVMGQGQGCCLGNYSAIEREAFHLLYGYPAATDLARLLADERLTRNVLTPFPRIDQIRRWDVAAGAWRNAKEDPGGPDSADFWARPGDWILLNGSRMTLRWSSEYRVAFRPPDYAPPEIFFGNTPVTGDLEHQRCPTTPPASPCTPGEPSNNWAGSPARFLKVRVPAGAVSGWIYVQVRELESNPVWLEVR